MNYQDKVVNSTHVIRHFECTGSLLINATDEADVAAFDDIPKFLHAFILRKIIQEQDSNKKRSLLWKVRNYMVAIAIFVATARFTPDLGNNVVIPPIHGSISRPDISQGKDRSIC